MLSQQLTSIAAALHRSKVTRSWCCFWTTGKIVAEKEQIINFLINNPHQKNSRFQAKWKWIERIKRTCLFLLSRSTTPLKNFKLNKSHRHQPQCKPRHNSSEKHEKTRHTRINKPPWVSEFNVLIIYTKGSLRFVPNS